MPGITDPSEEYFKDGLWAWVTDQWKKLIGDDAGHLQVDVVESGLPSGAATSANQATMITALQLIDDLRAALTSVHTDSLDVRLDGQTADVEIKQTTAADLTPGINGWDGSAWRKLPLLWGYSGVYAETMSNLNADAGDEFLTLSVVPAGEVWIITAVAAHNATKATGTILLGVEVSSVQYWIARSVYSTVTRYISYQGHLVIKAGDRLKAVFKNCDAGDDLYVYVTGYKMKVAE